jgi:hypothetical protein
MVDSFSAGLKRAQPVLKQSLPGIIILSFPVKNKCQTGNDDDKNSNNYYYS